MKNKYNIWKCFAIALIPTEPPSFCAHVHGLITPNNNSPLLNLSVYCMYIMGCVLVVTVDPGQQPQASDLQPVWPHMNNVDLTCGNIWNIYIKNISKNLPTLVRFIYPDNHHIFLKEKLLFVLVFPFLFFLHIWPTGTKDLLHNSVTTHALVTFFWSNITPHTFAKGTFSLQHTQWINL